MTTTVHDVVRQLCLAFPQAEEFVSHGAPTFRVRGGRTFAMYQVNHHGDRRVALWLNSPPGAQETHVRAEPKHFFVPPYVGPSGWLGVHLDKGLSWKRIAVLVREAYEKAAPRKLRERLGGTPVVSPPKRKLTAEEIDPMQSARAQRLLKTMRKICLALPETSEGEQFGSPVWRAGKKVFAQAYCYERLKAGFWVGVERQGLLTMDERISIPSYSGHNGWIELDVHGGWNEAELRELALSSYRHFANRRMQAALETKRPSGRATAGRAR